MGTVHCLDGLERETSVRVNSNHLLFKGDSNMDKRDQELLDKQLRGVSRRPPDSGIVILGLITVFLIGIGIGDILSKTKQSNANPNANYAAIFANGKE